ncbi:MAG: spore cortex-lytic enzyme [Oscillospiraceae bacterium]|nr:spore cortex-lytic enzyme [Oscillospiraceae bacterium]
MKSKIEMLHLKELWQATVILLLCTLFIVAIPTAPYSNFIQNPQTEQTLSKIGSRGDEVRKVQNKLRELGFYKGSADGIFGTQTQSAVKAFQRSVGITVDGIAGPKTLLYLGLGGGSTGSSSGGGGGYSSNDQYLLAKIIAAEARGEPYSGQVAVGAVVLNRVKHASFPDSISGVVYQGGAFTAVRDSNWSVQPDASSQKAAKDAINGWDPSGGAIYYYNPDKTSNAWIRTRPVITRIGTHLFCK